MEVIIKVNVLANKMYLTFIFIMKIKQYIPHSV